MSSSPINPVVGKRHFPFGSEENANKSKKPRTDSSYPSTKADPTPFYRRVSLVHKTGNQKLKMSPITVPKVPYSPPPPLKIPTMSRRLSHIIQLPTYPPLPSQPKNPTSLQIKLPTSSPLPSQPKNPTLLPISSQKMLPKSSPFPLGINRVVKSPPPVSFITQARQQHGSASAKSAGFLNNVTPLTDDDIANLNIFNSFSGEGKSIDPSSSPSVSGALSQVPDENSETPEDDEVVGTGQEG